MEKRGSLAVAIALTFGLLFLASAVSPAHARTSPKAGAKHPSKFTFYLHNTVRNLSSNHFGSVVSARPSDLLWPTQFGALNTFQDPLTEGPLNTSKVLGKGQGFYLYDDQQEFVLFFVFTAVIDTDEYKGTIDIMGQDPTNVQYRYLSVIGGTGDFFLARGLATVQLVQPILRNPKDLQVTWTLSFDLDLYY